LRAADCDALAVASDDVPIVPAAADDHLQRLE
jgi:hypothetical protein